uniref:Odorant receptor n=1 Tax=Adelphocoris lineolatus TaxID=236346 RepID=A0A2I4PH63_ADELI|nr:olfactory receptor 71 [Adelphocoris lineolatus]
MEADDGTVNEVLLNSGLINWIGIVGGIRFAQRTRFKKNFQSTIYWFYEIFTDLTVFINILSQIFALMASEKMTERCLIGFPLVSCSFCFFISNYPRFKRQEFATLVLRYDDVFPNTQYSDHLEEEIKKAAERVRLTSTILVFLELGPMFTFCLILPLVNEASGFALGPRKVAIPSLWPWDPLASFKNYIILVFIHAWASIFVNLKKIGFEESFFIFASRQVALLRHLRYNLEKLFDPLEVNVDGTVNKNEFTSPQRYWMEEKLTQWVKDHQHCLRLFYELEALYKWPICIYFGATILILCTSTFVTSDNSIDSQTCIICGVFTTGIFCELFFICRMGDHIQIETEELLLGLSGKNAFLSNWKEFKYLRMIMTRCQKESVIRAAGGFPLTISTFKSITTSSYSYYTLLKEVNGKLTE